MASIDTAEHATLPTGDSAGDGGAEGDGAIGADGATGVEDATEADGAGGATVPQPTSKAIPSPRPTARRSVLMRATRILTLHPLLAPCRSWKSGAKVIGHATDSRALELDDADHVPALI